LVCQLYELREEQRLTGDNSPSAGKEHTRGIQSSQYILDWYKLTDEEIARIVSLASEGPLADIVNELPDILKHTQRAVKNYDDQRTDVEILKDQGLNDQQIVQLSRLSSHVSRSLKGYRFRGHSFDSQREAACALLMEKYISAFRIKEGLTFQWPTADGRLVDFYLGEIEGVPTFVEYHPIIAANPRFSMSDFETESQF